MHISHEYISKLANCLLLCRVLVKWGIRKVGLILGMDAAKIL